MTRWPVLTACLFLIVVAPLAAGVAAVTVRTVSATARCTDDAGVRHLALDITNGTGENLRVAFARPLIGPITVTEDEFDVGEGQTAGVALTSNPRQISFEVALIVTSAGVLQPSCNGPPASLDLGATPATEVEAKEESAAIAARTLSILESYKAYDALYALLHPDVKVLASYEAVACWYDQQLAGRTTAEAKVNGVRFAPWTWGVTRETHPDAAMVDYTQPFWSGGVREEFRGVESLVKDHGMWRWFFGTSRDELARLPTSCGWTNQVAPSAEDSAVPPSAPSTEDQACGDFAQLWMIDSGAGLNAEGVAALSGCRLDSTGAWFFPTGPDDPRLIGGPPLTPEERQRTDSLRAEIERQIAEFEVTLDSRIHPLIPGNRWQGETLRDAVNELYDPVRRPARGHLTLEVSRGSPALNGVREWYAEMLYAYVVDPNHLALRSYVAWWGQRRQAALPGECLNAATYPCVSLRNVLDIDVPPWPWDLRDPLTLDSFLEWALGNGLV